MPDTGRGDKILVDPVAELYEEMGEMRQQIAELKKQVEELTATTERMALALRERREEAPRQAPQHVPPAPRMASQPTTQSAPQSFAQASPQAAPQAAPQGAEAQRRARLQELYNREVIISFPGWGTTTFKWGEQYVFLATELAQGFHGIKADKYAKTMNRFLQKKGRYEPYPEYDLLRYKNELISMGCIAQEFVNDTFYLTEKGKKLYNAFLKL